jgi:hypothetical protein
VGDQLHARRRDGELRYRIWSTVVDDYLHEGDLTEDDARRFTRNRALERAMDEHERTWPRVLSRALNPYASLDKPGLDAPWEDPTDWRPEEDHETP